jgi:hypothetical protein
LRRNRLRLTIYTVSALLAAGGGVGVAVAATGPASPAGLTAAFSKDSDWGSGYQGRFTVSNPGAAARTGWRLEFTLPAGASLGSFWDANITRSGNTLVATDRGYNAAVAAGAATSFGIIVAGSGAPTSCTINGAPCAGGAQPAPSNPATVAPIPTKSSAPAPKPTSPKPTSS